MLMVKLVVRNTQIRRAEFFSRKMRLNRRKLPASIGRVLTSSLDVNGGNLLSKEVLFLLSTSELFVTLVANRYGCQMNFFKNPECPQSVPISEML